MDISSGCAVAFNNLLPCTAGQPCATQPHTVEVDGPISQAHTACAEGLSLSLTDIKHAGTRGRGTQVSLQGTPEVYHELAQRQEASKLDGRQFSSPSHAARGVAHSPVPEQTGWNHGYQSQHGGWEADARQRAGPDRTTLPHGHAAPQYNALALFRAGRSTELRIAGVENAMLHSGWEELNTHMQPVVDLGVRKHHYISSDNRPVQYPTNDQLAQVALTITSGALASKWRLNLQRWHPSPDVD